MAEPLDSTNLNNKMMTPSSAASVPQLNSEKGIGSGTGLVTSQNNIYSTITQHHSHHQSPQPSLTPTGPSSVPATMSGVGMTSAGGTTSYPPPAPISSPKLSSLQQMGGHHSQYPQQQQQVLAQAGTSNVSKQRPTGSASSSATKITHSSHNVVGTHYRIGKKIGEGSFGIIYEGFNMLTNTPVAIKFEPRKSDAPQLRDEYRTYKILANCVGIPAVYYFGQEGLHNILCIDLLGPSLEDMFDVCGRKFSVKTCCMAAKQMLARVQTIHERNLIYRDIKPDNFLTGRHVKSSPTDDGFILDHHSPDRPHPTSMIFVVDFGMAKQYRDPKTKVHIPYREKKSLSGTARYMSINTHQGKEQSRRDDLEALGHVFMYFMRGSLPWQGLKAATNKQKYEKIGEKKATTPIRDLCDGMPDEFATYLATVRGLKFDETPDYDFLISLFDNVLRKLNLVDDGVFDWMEILDKQRRAKMARDANGRTDRQSNGIPTSLYPPPQQGGLGGTSSKMSPGMGGDRNLPYRSTLPNPPTGSPRGGFGLDQQRKSTPANPMDKRNSKEVKAKRGDDQRDKSERKWWKKLFAWCR